MIIPTFLQGLGLGVSAATSPGPFQTFLINRSLDGGWRQGATIAFAPLISDGPIVLLILLFINQIPPWFIRLLSLAGGAFVLYLAGSLWRQWRQIASSQASGPAQTTPAQGGLWQGVIMNALSPGPYTFWAFVNGPIVIAAWQRDWSEGLAFLIGFYGTMISTSIGLAILFDQARRLSPGIVRGLTVASIVILLISGVILVGRGIMG